MPSNFKGTFPLDCQEMCVPDSLKALVDMILGGPSIKKKDAEDDSSQKACLTIAQLLAFNSTKRASEGNPSSYSRHSREREYPLPVYVALKVHGETRKKSLIDAFFNLGLCISYDRLICISTDLANSVTSRFEEEGVVCPPNLRQGIFTTAGVDNIDHNPSATTAHDSFHGTAISLVQHPTTSSEGSDRGIPVIDETTESQRNIAQLPEAAAYTNVQPAFLQVKDPIVPPVVGNLKDYLSWAGFHASRQPPSAHTPAIISLLPMFVENAHSVAIILHAMNVIKSTVQHVNPGQVPVITLDQPLFAIAKQIQWNWPSTHGEDQFLVMLGGLHIEMGGTQSAGKLA